MLSTLLKIANKNESMIPPPNSSPNVGLVFVCLLLCYVALAPHKQAVHVSSPAHWPSVKTSLVKSICIGVFFDRKYWARHLKTRDAFRPVYFSSMIMGDTAHQLHKRRSEVGHELAEALRIVSGKIL